METSFKYTGSVFQEDGRLDKEINMRKANGNIPEDGRKHSKKRVGYREQTSNMIAVR